MNLLGQKISDYKRILMLIASKDIPGLRRLIATALRRGLNAERIVKLIQKAMAGIYAPQGRFSDRDLGPSFCPLGIVSVLGRVLLRLGIRRPRYSSC
jgi:hypothetical protein